jgi:diacylglycerol O-acyltransferase
VTRMSDAEAVMWTVEKDPALRSDFCNLTIVDGPISRERIRAKIMRAIAALPRLGQRVVSPPFRLAPPEWVDDPELDLDYHLRTVAVPAPGGMREVLDLCAALAEAPFDRSRPMWEFTVIEGVEGGRSALMQKVHHTITDGVGGLKLSLEIVDLEADPPDAPPAPRTDPSPPLDAPPDTPAQVPSQLDTVRGALSASTTRGFGLACGALASAGRVLVHPTSVPGHIGGAASMVSSLRRQLLITQGARSDVIDDRSVRRHFETMQLPMAPAMAAAKQLGGSLNDLFVTAVAGALGAYHRECGSEVAELRMGMPVSTRTRGETAANRFAPSRVLVPIQAVDAAARFEATRARLDATKREPALNAAEGLAGIISGLPTAALVAMTRSQTRTIDFVTSNLRGSPVPLYLAGARIVATFPFGPRTGCAVNVTMISYCDELQLGINIDPAAIADIGLFLQQLNDAFAELLSLVAS